jgi:hypothetical protein
MFLQHPDGENAAFIAERLVAEKLCISLMMRTGDDEIRDKFLLAFSNF